MVTGYGCHPVAAAIHGAVQPLAQGPAGRKRVAVARQVLAAPFGSPFSKQLSLNHLQQGTVFD